MAALVLSQLSLWLFWHHQNFNLAMDIHELRQQESQLTFALELRQQKLAKLTSLRYLVLAGRRMQLTSCRQFVSLTAPSLAWLAW